MGPMACIHNPKINKVKLCLVMLGYVGICRFGGGGKLGVLVVTCVFKIIDFVVLERSGVVLEHSGVVLQRSGILLDILGSFWSVLGSFWSILGSSWNLFGFYWCILGSFWSILGSTSYTRTMIDFMMDRLGY